RHAPGEDATLVMDNAMRLADLREAHACGRVRVDHASHVGTGGVDARVDPELAVGLALALHDAALRIDREERRGLGEAGAAPRGQEECVGPGHSSARMAECVRQAHALDDAIGGGDVLAQAFHLRPLPRGAAARSPPRTCRARPPAPRRYARPGAAAARRARSGYPRT